ncbi:MAG: DUF1456 family protein [Methyloprofundus sp.]|nr:DUF1456 family protein [Methyloprofundus sp.]
MTNNDILRRIRYTFDCNDDEMIELFSFADLSVTREQISNWLKKDDDPDYKSLGDEQLAVFLNGLIINNRGKREDAPPPPIEKKLTNNIIFRKLKIALDFKDDDILGLLDTVDFRLSRHELSAFFRKPTHKHYRECKDQVLRNFLNALQNQYRK